jgi:protein-S-isoprenylcysteine O-methyltransferase Ste14
MRDLAPSGVHYANGSTTMFNWLAISILLAAIATSAYFRSRARLHSETISRRRESGLFMAIRATAAFSFLVIIFANALNPQRMAWALLALPNTIRWFGVFLGLLAILSAWWLLRSLGNNVSETVLTKKNHQLVMIGPYRWVRHPMYTTGIALCVAIGIMQASWLLLLVAAAMVLLMQFVVIPAEERALTAKFGAQYQAYMTQTGRWLPRL